MNNHVNPQHENFIINNVKQINTTDCTIVVVENNTFLPSSSKVISLLVLPFIFYKTATMNSFWNTKHSLQKNSPIYLIILQITC